MIFEEHEINLIKTALKEYMDSSPYDGILAKQVCAKLNSIQSNSYNRRYTVRSTDWISEANRKRAKRTKVEIEGLL